VQWYFVLLHVITSAWQSFDFLAAIFFLVARLRYIEPVYLYKSIILELSTARLPSVCSSKHEAGQGSFWFELLISLG